MTTCERFVPTVMCDPFEQHRYDLLGYLAARSGASPQEVLEALGAALLERLRLGRSEPGAPAAAE